MPAGCFLGCCCAIVLEKVFYGAACTESDTYALVNKHLVKTCHFFFPSVTPARQLRACSLCFAVHFAEFRGQHRRAAHQSSMSRICFASRTTSFVSLTSFHKPFSIWRGGNRRQTSKCQTDPPGFYCSTFPHWSSMVFVRGGTRFMKGQHVSTK